MTHGAARETVYAPHAQDVPGIRLKFPAHNISPNPLDMPPLSPYTTSINRTYVLFLVGNENNRPWCRR
jgi:hypothetical protein